MADSLHISDMVIRLVVLGVANRLRLSGRLLLLLFLVVVDGWLVLLGVL